MMTMVVEMMAMMQIVAGGDDGSGECDDKDAGDYDGDCGAGDGRRMMPRW